MPASSDHVLALANARAGGAADDAVRVAVAGLRRHTEVDLARTAGPEALVEALAAAHPRRCVVIGGDGSVHEVVGALDRLGLLPETTVGIVPLGTGNDLARSLGLPLDPGEAAEVAATGRVRAVDALADDTGDLVVNAVHAGVGAEAARVAEVWKPRLGPLAYRLGSVVAGARTRGWRLRVEADGERLADVDRRLLMVGLALGRTVGGGSARLAPDARLSDGRADLVLTWAVGPVARVGYALHLRRGTHPDRRDVQTRRVRQVRVEGQAFPYNADGELGGPVTARSWTVRPGAWKVVVPG